MSTPMKSHHTAVARTSTDWFGDFEIDDLPDGVVALAPANVPATAVAQGLASGPRWRGPLGWAASRRLPMWEGAP